MVSTICDAESLQPWPNLSSTETFHYTAEIGSAPNVQDLPTRLSTKLTFRSDCRSRQGGGRAHGRPVDWAGWLLVRRGCLRSSGATAVSAGLQAPFREQRTAASLDGAELRGCEPASCSQITSTEADEMELCEDAPSSEKIDEDEEEAEEETDEVYGCACGTLWGMLGFDSCKPKTSIPDISDAAGSCAQRADSVVLRFRQSRWEWQIRHAHNTRTPGRMHAGMVDLEPGRD